MKNWKNLLKLLFLVNEVTSGVFEFDTFFSLVKYEKL